MQAARYDLSKQVDAISYARQQDGRWTVSARKNNQPLLDKRGLTLDQVGELVGKDIAEKMENGVGREVGAPEGSGELRGVDLKVGGEGMRSFYDRELVNTANKLGKKFGAKVEPANLKYYDTPGGARTDAALEAIHDVSALRGNSHRSGIPRDGRRGERAAADGLEARTRRIGAGCGR